MAEKPIQSIKNPRAAWMAFCLTILVLFTMSSTSASGGPPQDGDVHTRSIVEKFYLDETINFAPKKSVPEDMWSRDFNLPDPKTTNNILTFHSAGDHSTEEGASDDFQWSGASWSTLGDGLGPTNSSISVLALAVDNKGRLYAGGRQRIAYWDGNSWSYMPGIGGGYYPTVGALAADHEGNLYVGGRFNAAGAIAANNIARWDGTNWWALGSGTEGGYWDSGVLALAVDSSGNLYAAGVFTEVGGVSANWIAKWDGTSWSALGDGIRGESYETGVFALAIDSEDNLYAGGRFSTAGGEVANNVAVWNGTSWSDMGSGMDGTVHTLTVDQVGNLYAGGEFTNAGGTKANLIAMWDGSNWSAMGSGMDGSEDEVNRVLALAHDGAGNLYAGGNFTSAGGVSANFIAMWDETSWWALGSGMGGTISSKYPVYDYPIVQAMAFDGAWGIYAGGGFQSAGGIPAANVALWLNLPHSVLIPITVK